MKIVANATMMNIAPTVTVSHLGNTLTFSISCYRKKKFDSGFDVFSQINAYWADQSPQVQQAIYDIYSEIFTLFDNLYTKDSLRENLQNKVDELLAHHDLEYVQFWISSRCPEIRIPDAILSTFVPDLERNISIGKTYLVGDYIRLTAFSLVLRCLIPVWGEYIFSIKNNTDENFREMQAYQLVDRSFTPKLPVVAKLMDYLDNFVASVLGSKDMPKATSVLKGIATSDYSRWLLALVTINCLSIGDIRGSNPEAHLVTYIYIYISSKISPKEEFGDSRIKEKEITNDSEEENRATASALERYKVKANISIGNIVEAERFLSEPYKVAELLSPGIPKKAITEAMARIKDYVDTPTLPQMVLMRWLFSAIVPTQMHLYMPEPLIKDLLAVSEAVLWERGHHYLALLVTCQPIISETEFVTSLLDSKMRIPDPLIAELDALFPFRQNQRNRKNPTRDTNFAMLNIDSLTNEFINFGWRPTSDADKVFHVLNSRTTRYLIKPDIKTDFARLVIELQKKRSLSANLY